MRIAIATYDRTVHGGTETYLRALLPALAARGHGVALLCEEEKRGPFVDDGVTVPRCLVRERGLEGALAWLRDLRPDVVYAQGLIDPDLEDGIVAEHRTVLFAHGHYGTCVSGTKLRAFPRLQVCTRALGPGCLVRYLPNRCGGLRPLRALADYRLQSRRRANLRRFAAVLAGSEHVRDEMTRHGAGRVHVVPFFPTDVTRLETAPAPRPMTGEVLFLGRMTAIKGGADLVRAVPLASRALGRPLRLVLAGDGPERAAWERLARGDARFEGWVGPERRRELLASADVVAVPSVWPEPFGLVGLEAASLGVPAVARRVGGIPTWLIGGVTGELAEPPPAGFETLAEALVRALRDPEHHQALRVGAWSNSSRFTLDGHADALVRTFEEVLP